MKVFDVLIVTTSLFALEAIVWAGLRVGCGRVQAMLGAFGILSAIAGGCVGHLLRR